MVDCWTSRVHSKGQDPYGLGRWSYITLKGKQDSLITIITAYRVCQKSSSSTGLKTAYIKQLRALQRKLISPEKPKPNSIDYVLISNYPGIDEQLGPLQITYETLIEAVSTTETQLRNGAWGKIATRSYLCVHGLNKEAIV